MIEIKNLTKRFDDTIAINNMNCDIKEGNIVGLAGSNGSGKSTLLRTISGVYQADGGSIVIDGQEAFDNHVIKEKCYYIADYPYFFNDSTVDNMAQLYKKLYASWDEERYAELCDRFPIERDKRIINMSKGMQRQASLILAFSCRPKYLLLDEIFDGLDPVIRKLLKEIIIEEVTDRNMTCIIASHNLREVDDICDKIVLIHNGELITNNDTDEVKQKMHKIQIAFNETQYSDIFNDLGVEIISQMGNYYRLMAKGDIDEIMADLEQLNPAFIEVLPATLEEVFINEMEGAGYGK